MKRVLLSLFGALLLASDAMAKPLEVLATVPDLAAIAKEVGGDDVIITSMSLSTQDPHFIDARPNLALKLSKADALLAVGLELETGWLPTLQVGSRNPAIQAGGRGYLELAGYVRLLEVPAGAIDRSMGDVHPGGNPHFLYDPRAGSAVAMAIAGRFASLDPEHRAAYDERAAAFVRRLDEERRGWEAELAGLRGVPIVTFHRSFAYLVDWVGLEVVETIEPKPGIPPDPRHVARIVEVAKQRGVKTILQESYYPDTTSVAIAEKVGAKVLRMPAGTDFAGGQSYFAHMDEVIARLKEATP